MRKKIRETDVYKTEEEPLSAADIAQLTKARNKLARFMLSGYLPFTAILLYILFAGLQVIYRRKFIDGYQERGPSEDAAARFHLVVPYVCGFFFLALTIYFYKYYRESLAPLIKDLKENKKLLLYYIPEKTAMPVFSKYYLSSPVLAKQQVIISKEQFDSIPNQHPVILEIAAHSCSVLRFRYDENELRTL